tara:strand:- start:90 stop:428 length:339 start_codon:yes stop_codon:yes gene_type:complete
MAATIKLKRGTSTPSTSDIASGEVAIDTSAKKLYVNDSGTIKAIGGDVPTTITVADESSDTTCFPLFATAASGDLGPKSGTNLTFNSSSGDLTATLLNGGAGSNLDLDFGSI